jgi:hypothetical protein
MADAMQGIMGLSQAPQGPQAMPVDPAAEAAFEQARSSIPSSEFTSELLSAAEQADPAAVQEFKQALQQAQLPPEVLDALGQMVDAILAEPENYAEMRAGFIAEGVPEDFLPEEFDATFFGALNLALDQLSAPMEAAAPQGFAAGGFVRTPVAAGIAGLGRNGDTMLAHITPAEARMLRRRGGSGTINPATGRPEFFLKKVFKAVGKVIKGVGKAISGVVKGVVGAVKKFASSTIGRVIATVALGFFLGPAAASFLGVSSAAGVAAVSGFIGSAGSTLLAGGSIKDALKAGAVGGITAGIGAGVMGGAEAFQAGSYTGPTTIGGQFDRAVEGFKSLTGLGTENVPAPATVGPESVSAYSPTPGAGPEGFSYDPNQSPMFQQGAGSGTAQAAIQSPVATDAATQAIAPAAPGVSDVGYYPNMQADTLGGVTPPSGTAGSFWDATKQAGSDVLDYFSPSARAEAGTQAAKEVFTETYNSTYKDLLELPGQTADSAAKGALAAAQKAQASATPGIFSTYAPMVAAGTGIMALTGAFTPKQPEAPGLIPSETGADLLAQDPGKYGTTPGGANTVFMPPMQTAYDDPYRFQGPRFQLNAPQYPRFAANGGEIRGYAEGGLASLMNRASKSQYQPISVFYDSKAKQYVMQNPEYKEPARRNSLLSLMFGGYGNAFLNAVRRRRESRSNPSYVPFNPQLFTSGMSPAEYYASQKAAAATPFFTPGGAQAAPTPVQAPAVAPTTEQAPAFTAPQYIVNQPTAMFAEGGIAGLSGGGSPRHYPRKVGQISGPGTEKSDSIPAMLSDGEFVMTAQAVRGAGGGSRREGAKRMYAMMRQFERKA